MYIYGCENVCVGVCVGVCVFINVLLIRGGHIYICKYIFKEDTQVHAVS